MPKQTKSQWDFGGELFSPEESRGAARPAEETAPAQPTQPVRKILSVSELTAHVRRLLEQQVGTIWVTGEVTNLRAQSSGHVYFTLKDAGSQLSCVLFRNEPVGHRELLQDGQKLLLQGDVTVYEARGQYQLIVRDVELQGTGALQIAFEKLKQKLAAEGLFAPERKRALPRYPQAIGIVTSPTGAAIRDVLHVVRRRNPSLEIILAPCRVQGEGAAREIDAAIRMLNEFASSLDLILVTRGGGSLEDLWAFNEEIVARAIFESALPVVSAIGHEIDFTISDFVADLRAATPSAAAEIITEGVFSSCEFVSDAANRLRQLAGQQLEGKESELRQLGHRLARMHPRRRFNDWLQRLDDLHGGMLRCARQGLRQQTATFQNLSERLARVRPVQLLKQRRELFEQEHARLEEQMKHRLRELQNRAEALESRLRLLSPEQVLARGYSITTDAESGKVLRDASTIKPGQRLKTRLHKGEVASRAMESE
ncbi:MAG TPA: exodeoxyribonuclease VII large subunit [Verrucomicrobiae bacterium]|jgi:exodeoxyribonuclease VII large subunit|nr:exodeoxyribonuclease VII large subunit [Verrucomicrobiae bacterium]